MYTRLIRLLKSSTAYTIGNVVNRALFIISMPVMTRYLTPDEYGTLSLVNTIVGLMMTFYGLGIHDYAMRYYYEQGSDDERRRLMGGIATFLVLFALAMSIVLSILGGSVFPKLIKGIPFSPCVLIGIWICFVASFETVPDALFRVRDQPLLFVVVNLVKSALCILLSIVSVVFLNRGAEGPLSASLVVSAALVLYFLAYLRGKASPNLSPSLIKEGLKFSLPVLLLLLGRVFLDSTDRLFLQHYRDLSVVGFYSVGSTLGAVLVMIAQSVNIAWAPFFYETAKQEGTKEAKEMLSYASTYLTTTILFLGLCPVVFRQEIISLLAPPTYHGVIEIVPLIMMGAVLSSLFFVPVRAIYQQKKTGYLPWMVLLGLLVNVPMNLLLIPSHGMLGAALGTIGGAVVMLVVCLMISQKLYYIPYQYGRIAKAGIACLVCYVLSNLAWGLPMFVSIICKGLVICLFPFLLYGMRFFDERELKRAGEFVSGFLTRVREADKES